MHRLHLLGTAHLEGPNGRLTGAVVQRHRLALLALLTLARDATIPRERLVALLWPDHADRDARHLLNVSVHVIRKALGDEVISTEGGDLRLDTTRLPSDLADFRSALARSSPLEAVESYAGPLLDGFFLEANPDFDSWKEHERRKLEDEFASALEAVAERAAHAGDWSQAIVRWRQLWTRAPERERSTEGLMLALAAGGDRAEALRVAEAHEQVLAREFGAGVTPAVARLADRLRVHPADEDAVARRAATSETEGPVAPMLSAAATMLPVAAPPPPPVAGASATSLPAPVTLARRRRWWMVAGGIGLTAAVLLGVVATRWRAGNVTSVAVLPFADLSPAADRAYLGAGLTEELRSALSRLSGLRVAGRSSSLLFVGDEVDARAAGRRLGVAAVVEGSVRVEGDRLRVTAQLTDTRTGYQRWSGQFDRRVSDVLAVQGELARTVARSLGATLGGAAPPLATPRGTRHPQAHDLYLRGRFAWNSRTSEGMRQALRAFEGAIALDPSYANAYAGLADTWQLLPDYDGENARGALARAKTAALRAIALDSSLAEAHTSLGALRDDYDRDRAAAERSYRQAILLNPQYPTARHWLALHLADEGRHAEAAAEIERARRLDPLSRIVNTAVGTVRYFARDYSGAIAEYRAVLDQSPDFALGWALLGRVYLVQGRADSALATLARAVQLSQGDPSYLAVQAAALAHAGRQREGRALADSLRRAPDDGYTPFCELASAYLYLGDHDTALALFARGIDALDPATKHMAVEPLYDQVRGDARFVALLARIGLAPSRTES